MGLKSWRSQPLLQYIIQQSDEVVNDGFFRIMSLMIFVPTANTSFLLLAAKCTLHTDDCKHTTLTSLQSVELWNVMDIGFLYGSESGKVN